MANKLVAFRLPEELIEAVDAQAKATGRDRTAVVLQALKLVFELPSSEKITVEELHRHLNEVTITVTSITEQLAKLNQPTSKPVFEKMEVHQ